MTRLLLLLTLALLTPNALAQGDLVPQKIPLPAAVRSNAVFSPDAKWIYYFQQIQASRFPDMWALFRCMPDGGEAQELFKVGAARFLRFHPDGKRLVAYVKVRDTNRDRKIDYQDKYLLFLSDLDGKNGKYLAPPFDRDVHLSGITLGGKFLMSYPIKDDPLKKKFVLRDESGVEEEIGKASVLYIRDGEHGFIGVIEGDQNNDGRTGYDDVVYYHVDLINGKKLGPFGVNNLSNAPLKAYGKYWYKHQIDTNGDNKIGYGDDTFLTVSDLDGKNGKNIFIMAARSCSVSRAFRGGLLCVERNGWLSMKYTVLFESGEQTLLLASSNDMVMGHPSVSDDNRMVFVGIRDTNKDGKFKNNEDESDIYLLEFED